jgi:hypothetical protein
VEATTASGISSRTTRSLDGDDGEASAAQRIPVLDPEEEGMVEGVTGEEEGRRQATVVVEAGRRRFRRRGSWRPADRSTREQRSGRVWKGLERGGCVEGCGGGNNEGRKK